MHIDLPSEAEVRALLEVTGTTCVSIYMPATPDPVDAEAERITFKGLASEAMDQLREHGLDKRELAAFDEVLASVDEDPFFWRHQARSLAVFADRDEVNVYRLANQLEPAVVVADRFFVKPLIRVLSFPSAGFVLSLAQGGVQLLEFGDDYGPIEVEVDDLPEDLGTFVDTVPGATSTSETGLQSPEGQNSRLRKYARQVDRAIRDAVRGHDLPVVIAAAEPLASVFRSITTLRTVAEEMIVGNPERVPGVELVASARRIVDGVHAARLEELKSRFEARAAQGRTAIDLSDLARAATFGAVAVLLVDIDQVVRGSISDEGALSYDAGPGSYDVVDEMARRVLEASGEVVAVRAEDVPGGGAAAAILRYA